MSHELKKEPLTPEELEELQAFMLERNPEFGQEIVDLRNKGLVPKLPLLLRILFNDMRKIQAEEGAVVK
jgi:hypothetical protein